MTRAGFGAKATDDGGEGAHHAVAGVERAGAAKSDPRRGRPRLGFDVQVEEDLDMVAQKADRAEDDIASAVAGGVEQTLAEGGTEPRLRARALALKDDAPGPIELRAGGHRGRRFFDELGVAIASLHDGEGEAV